MNKIIVGLCLALSATSIAQISADSATALFPVGVQETPNPTVASISGCADTLTVIIPAGNYIYSVDVSYTLEGGPGFFGSAPNDIGVYLSCLTQNATEAQLSFGTVGANGAIETINRNNLQFATGPSVAPNLQFTLNAFVNAFFGANCDTVTERVSDWKVIVNHGPPPTCFKPSTPSVNWVMHNRAELNWQSGGASNWQIEYGPLGFALGSGTLANATSRPFTLSGLSPTTAYEFYVRDSCGLADVSLWSDQAAAFTTLCNPLTFATSYTENFDGAAWTAGAGVINAGNTIDACWTRNPAAAAPANQVFAWGTGTAATASANTGPSADVSGTGNYLYVEASAGANQDVATISSPLIDVSALTVPALEFSYHRFGVGVGELKAQIWSRTTGWVDVWAQTGPQNQTATTDPWLLETVTLGNFANDTIRIRFRAVRSFDLQGDIAVDEVSIKEAPSCPTPTNLTEVARTTTSVTLGFNSTNATNWQVSFGPVATSAAAGTKVLVSSNPATVTGLAVGTTYDFYVRSICALGDTSPWVGPLTVATFCAPTAAPYTENFDGTGWLAGTGVYNGGDTLAPCWSRNPLRGSSAVFPVFWGIRSTPTTTPNTGPAADNSGTGNFAYLEASAGSVGQQAYLESPFLDLTPLTTPELRFFYHLFGNAMGTLSVDVFSATSQTWTNGVYTRTGQVQTAGADPYLQAIVDLSAFAGDSIVLRFTGIKGNERFGDMAIDDISVDEQPLCPQPDSLAASNITATTVDLNWLSGGATNWQVEYGPVGFTLGTGTLVNAATNPFTLTGLNAAQVYDIYLRDSCGLGNTSIWIGPITITTACGLISTLPWSENFDGPTWTPGAGGLNGGNIINPCWTRPSAAGPNFGTGANGTPSGATGPAADFSGTGNYLYTEASGGAAGRGSITTPQIVLNTSVPSPTLEFYYHMFGATIDTLEVEIDNGSGFTSIYTLIGQQQTANGDAWQIALVPLTTYSGDTIQLRFSGVNSGFNADIAIDEVFIGNNSCPQPTGLTLNSLASTSASLSWITGGATNWQVAYGPVGGNVATFTKVAATSNPFTLSGLVPNTNYDIYVQDSCSAASVSLWAGPLTIQTLCGVVTAPYTESFDDTTWVPGAGAANVGNLINTCWQRPSGNAPDFGPSTGPTGSAGTGPALDASGTGQFLYTEFSGVALPFGEIISPAIFVPNTFTNPQVKFAYHMFGGAIDSLTVEVLQGALSTQVFSLVGAQQTANGDAWLLADADLTAYLGDTIQIRFRGYSNGFAGDIAIDDFAILDETCPKPSNLSATANTRNSITLSWTTGGATNWEIEYGPVGFTQGQGTVVAANTNPFAVTGLNASSNYNFYLRDSCGIADVSDWIGPIIAATACDTTLAPYFENFDIGFIRGVDSAGVQNAGATISPCWSRNQDTGYYWGGGTGFTPTGGTGPFGDNTSGNGNYVYVESSFALGGSVAILETPVIDLDTLRAPEMRFWYHMWAQNGSQGKLVWAIDSGNGYQNIDSLDGNQGFAWLELVTDLRAYAGATVQVRFTATKSNGATAQQGDIALDDFSIIEGTLCPDPDSLQVLKRTASTVEVDWVPGIASQWQVSSQVLGSSATTISGTTSRPYTFNSLSPSTTYVICVRDSCGPGQVSAWICDTVQTLCAPFAAPFTENFDGASWQGGAGALNAGNTVDACWERPNGDVPNFGTSAGPTASAATGPNADASGTGSFIYTEYSGGPTSPGIIYSPFIIVTSTLVNPELSFGYHMFGNAIDSLSVSIETSAGTQFLTSIIGQQQTSNADAFLTSGSDLSAWLGDTIRVLFEGYGSGFASDIAIDDFTIRDVSCPVPTNFTFVSSTLNSILVNWTSTAANSQIEYGPVGFALGTGTRVNVSGGSHNLTGLQAGTFYDLYLRDSCSATDTSLWVGPILANTQCGVIVAPYVENFDAGFNEGLGALNAGSTISPCWSRNIDSLYHWGGGTAGTPSGGTGPVADHTSGGGSYVYSEASGGVTGDTAILESPSIDMSALAAPELTFWLHMFSATSNPVLRWEIFSNGNWVLLDTLSGSQGNFWQEFKTDLSAYTGQTVSFRFITLKAAGGAAFQGDVSIDDLSIEDVPACAVTTLPFLENFNGNNWQEGTGALNNGDAIDPCWTRLISNQNMWTTGTATTPSANTGPLTDASGNGNYVYTEASRGGASAWLNTPRLFLDTNKTNPYLWFSYHMFGADIDTLAIEVNNGNGWQNQLTLIGGQQTASADPWILDSVDLSAFSGDTIEIRFRGASNNFAGDIALDDIRVDESILPCAEPQNFVLSAVTTTSFDVSWTSGGGTIVLSYYELTAGPGSAQTVSNVGSPYTINGLLPNTTYVVSLKDSCGATNLSASLNDTTITLPCPAVTASLSFNTTNLLVNFNAGASANADSLNWNFGDGNSGTGLTPSNTYAAAGSYTVTLIAFNTCGNADTITVTILICDALSPAFTLSKNVDTIFYDAATSTGAIGYLWNFGDGNSGTGVNGNHVYSVTGTYTVTLSVYNACGDTLTTTQTINVCGAPIADWTYSILPPINSGLRVQFDASASQNAVTYNWNFGDGNTGTGVNPIHIYATPGLSYTVSLTVTNSCADAGNRTFRLNQIGLEEQLLKAQVQAYPVPTSTELYLKWPAQDLEIRKIEVLDAAGRVVLGAPTEGNLGTHAINVRNLKAGFYFVQLHSNLGLIRKTFVVE
jgi:PKD repeat protein